METSKDPYALASRSASEKSEAFSSGVSWAAVIAGAFVTAALSLALLALGTGIGLSSVSPWSTAAAPASTASVIAIVWLVLTQIVASAIGGYLAGRLRTKWVNIHTDEVHFRDTAHGFLVWAVSLIVTVGFLTSAATAMVGGAASSGSAAFPSIQSGEPRLDSTSYFVDTLFRPDHSNPESSSTPRSEAANIFLNAIRQGDFSGPDKAYLSEVIASRTGVSQAEAEQRMSDTLTQMKNAADSTRKTVAHSLYWTFLALLAGAFCASFAATIGGKQRDHVLIPNV